MPDAAGDGVGALIALSAAIAARDPGRLGDALDRVAKLCDPAAVDEILLQAHLFVGFPLVLEAMRMWRERSPRPRPDAAEEPAVWRERGERVCAAVYAGAYHPLRETVAGLHPALDRWMVEGGYGRVLGRPGVDLPTRELCVAALLAVWDAPRQLHSHLRGALNVGASHHEVEGALQIAYAYMPPERAAQVRELWARISTATAVPADAARGAGSIATSDL